LIILIFKVSNDEKKLEGIHGSLQLIFDAIDSNQDEAISSEEFGIYFQSLGVSDNAFADVIFNEMDSNKDGLLNKHGLIDFLFKKNTIQ
jgi:Ca2+-binding EF-hand superfamily protein